jgi:Secretion system C-terminal sorting domain
MKKIILSIFLLASCLPSPAQRELWGINKGWDDPYPFTNSYNGNITKYDIHLRNPKVLHEFKDLASGKTPQGELFLASNDKLYGTTSAGGLFDPDILEHNGYGVLYEYDLVLNKYRVLHRFTRGEGYPFHGVIEPIPGKLYGSFGTFGRGSGIYTYDLNADSYSKLGFIDSASYVSSALMKASNGSLYFTIGSGLSGCPDSSKSVAEVNIASNEIQIVSGFNCDGSDGEFDGLSFGALVETAPGRLLGVAPLGSEWLGLENGLLFEFNIDSGIYTTKSVFEGDSLGRSPRMLIDGGDGKLIGVCRLGGRNVYISNAGDTVVGHYGTIFEYTPATNQLRKLHDFGRIQGSPGAWSGTYPDFIMKASTGEYLGLTEMGLFRFNPLDGSVVRIPYCFSCPDPDTRVTESFIEICRKPSYHEIVEDSVNLCTGDAFSLDLQSDNATAYAWKKDGTALPLQTTGILTLDSLRVADSGTYTCTMTNECGTTTTMPLHLSVGCSGLEVLGPLDHLLSIHPNPTRDLLYIRLRENSFLEIGGITVTNLLGQTVLSEAAGTTSIDVGRLDSGIYQLRVATSQGAWNGKFIKE